MANAFFENTTRRLPSLDHLLRVARIETPAADYVQKTTLSATIFTGIVAFFVFIMGYVFNYPLGITPIIALLFFGFMIYYNLNKPHFNIIKAEKYVEREIVSAIRFLILELKSERSLYGALQNVAKNFSLVGIYFDEIIDAVKFGMTLEQALTEAVEDCPSSHLRNLYWQLLNSLQTGADITDSLSVELDNIVEAQKIRVEEYGRELNALSLFYMMISIIIPTVGFTIISAVLTFIGFPITMGLLIGIWVMLTFIQYFFVIIASNRRPAVEAY